MTSKQYFAFLRWAVRAGVVFMILEGIYHGSGIRMAGAERIWPESAVAFSRLFMMLWASISIFVATVLFFVQKYLEQVKPLLVLLCIPTLLHALLLCYLSLTPYTEILTLPNLYAWIPFYEVWIRGEAAILITYVAYIAYGRWKNFL